MPGTDGIAVLFLICQCTIHERAKIGLKVPDIVPPFPVQQPDAIHFASALYDESDGVGDLDFIPFARSSVLDGSKDIRRKNVPRRDGQVAGSIRLRRLFDKVLNLENISAFFRLCNAIIADIG